MGDFISAHVSDGIWLCLTAVVAYGVQSLRELNSTIKLVVFRIDTHDRQLGDHEDRLRHIELS